MPTVVFDSETGHVITWPETGIPGPVAAVIASALLPGTSAEQVSGWYDAWLADDLDPTPCDPWRINATVEHAMMKWRGQVVDVRKADGETHSVKVRSLSGFVDWYSPIELTPVAP